MNTSLSAADAAELKAYRARDRRNARRRELRRQAAGGDYVAQQARQAAYAPLYAETGTVTLAELDQVARVHAKVLEATVIRLVDNEGYSWAEIGAELGISRQLARQRFGHLVKSSRGRGAQPANLR